MQVMGLLAVLHELVFISESRFIGSSRYQIVLKSFPETRNKDKTDFSQLLLKNY